MRDWGTIIYEWLRDHGQVIGAIISGMFAFFLFSLGWHVKREQKWRDHVEQQLALIMPRSEIVKAIEQAIADRNAQIAAINARLDRSEARIDRQFREQAAARSENLRVVRQDISKLTDRVEMLIRRELGHRDGPQG